MMPKGFKHSPETIEKMRAAHKGHGQKVGYRHTDETRAKMRAHNGQKSGPLNSCWRGGSHLTHFGYVKIRHTAHPFAKNGYVLEHRLVMEHHLGRYLSPSEHVHHTNGDRTDNHLENLSVMTNCEHVRHHRLQEVALGTRKPRTRQPT